jgi:uncharacterized membrane protein
MKEKNLAPLIVGGLVVLIVALCFLVPGFAGALMTTLECAFSPYTCVRVLP